MENEQRRSSDPRIDVLVSDVASLKLEMAAGVVQRLVVAQAHRRVAPVARVS